MNLGNFWRFYGNFRKNRPNSKLYHYNYRKKVDPQFFACASHNIWHRFKNPVCFENTQFIPIRLCRLFWILAILRAISEQFKIINEIYYITMNLGQVLLRNCHRIAQNQLRFKISGSFDNGKVRQKLLQLLQLPKAIFGYTKAVQKKKTWSNFRFLF